MPYGQPAKIPSDFLVNSLQLTAPGQLSSTNTVTLNYPSGSGSSQATKTLNANNNTAQITAVVSALYVTAFQIGILLGSVNGGLVYGHFGLGAVVATSAALFAVTLVGVLWRRDTFPV